MTTATDILQASPTFRLGDHVRKTKGSQWKGRVVGTYSTTLTPEGYAAESDTEKGSVQIYPVGALELVGEDAESGVEALVEALESLVKGYVNLLEAGRDRIASLGGDCDPVPVMEQSDPWLRDARATLAAHRKGGE